MSELPEVERTVEVTAEPEEVWERVVKGDLAEEWLGIRIDPRRGGNVSVPGREMIGTVEAVDRGRSITWTWREIDGEPSQVVIEIEPTETGSRIRVIERLLEYRIDGTPPFLLSAAA